MKLSCSTMGLCKSRNIFEALKVIKQTGFDGVDLSLNLFSEPGGALRSPLWWRQWVQAVRAYADELKLPIVQAHASWEQDIPADWQYVSPYHIYERTLTACRLLGCGRLVLHPLIYPYPVESAEQRQKILAYNIRWFTELLPCAEHNGVHLAIENLFDYFQLGEGAYCFSDAEQLMALLCKLPAAWVGACVDTGHAHISGRSVSELLRALGSRVEGLHLNDNYGRISGVYEDLHLFPGFGRLNWQEIFSALREIGYKGSINIEPVAELPRLPEKASFELLLSGRRILEEFAAKADML